MNRQEAWTIISDHVELGYEGDELEECRDYIKKYDEAYMVVSQAMRRRWWEIWK